jgi:peptide/nickel transport system permease protein
MTRARRIARWVAAGVLAIVFLAGLGANFIARHDYQNQFREVPDLSPCGRYPLGTDDLGRDRFSRLLYGTRVSLLLAPAAALISTILALLIGGLSAYLGGRWDRLAMGGTDLFLAMPTLMILLTVRALLPLDVSPWTSIAITCALLGVLGWATAARVVRSQVATLLNSDFLLQARASGCSVWRTFAVHLVPNLRPVFLAQFWISIPLFVLTEANLGLLGLGVAEPMPSWGNMLRELENYSAVIERPWMLAAPVLLVIVVSCFAFILPAGEGA